MHAFSANSFSPAFAIVERPMRLFARTLFGTAFQTNRCYGNTNDHCCYFGEPCIHLEEYTVPGRRWSCGLYRREGSWNAVYATPEWPAVLANAVTHGLGPGYRCGDWPPSGVVCASCGAIGG